MSDRRRTRPLVAALLAGLLLLPALPAVGAGASAAAVVPPVLTIVVGPTHSSTARYLERGESLARRGEELGLEVRRVFHPAATWAAVKAAASGANVFVYLGHGNGWPSPYGPFQNRTKNGIGLNPYAGASASSVEYYGANPIADQLRLAPGALVMLHGLCYASGNSEPNRGEPTLAVAIERVDRYAVGFRAAGAAAVLAYGIQSLEPVLEMLLAEPSRTIDQVFGSTGFSGANDLYFDPRYSAPGRGHLDPLPGQGYYRSVIGDLEATGATIMHRADGPPLPRASRVELTPRFSPNGDGRLERAIARATLTDASSWTLTLRAACGATVHEQSGTTSSVAAEWNGTLPGGAAAAEGSYSAELRATGPGGTITRSLGAVALDRSAPALSATAASDELSPATGGLFRFSYSLSERSRLTITVRAAGGALVRRWSVERGAGSGELSWNGRNGDGQPVPPGDYTLAVRARDLAGILSAPVALTVRVER